MEAIYISAFHTASNYLLRDSFQNRSAVRIFFHRSLHGGNDTYFCHSHYFRARWPSSSLVVVYAPNTALVTDFPDFSRCPRRAPDFQQTAVFSIPATQSLLMEGQSLND